MDNTADHTSSVGAAPQPSRRRRSPRRIALAVAGSMILAVAAIGGLHTPAGRRLMAFAGVTCPVMNASPLAVTNARAIGLAGLRGARPAPARPALGFVLDVSREADIARWATETGADCSRLVRGFVVLTCRAGSGHEATPSAALAADEEFAFAFGATGRLISIDHLRHPGSALATTQWFDHSQAELEAALGPPHKRAGKLEVVTDDSASIPLATAVVDYRFSDYLASLIATRLPSGVVVRERLQSALN